MLNTNIIYIFDSDFHGKKYNIRSLLCLKPIFFLEIFLFYEN